MADPRYGGLIRVLVCLRQCATCKRRSRGFTEVLLPEALSPKDQGPKLAPSPLAKGSLGSAVSSPNGIQDKARPQNDFPVFLGFQTIYSATLVKVNSSAEVSIWQQGGP